MVCSRSAATGWWVPSVQIRGHSLLLSFALGRWTNAQKQELSRDVEKTNFAASMVVKISAWKVCKKRIGLESPRGLPFQELTNRDRLELQKKMSDQTIPYIPATR